MGRHVVGTILDELYWEPGPSWAVSVHWTPPGPRDSDWVITEGLHSGFQFPWASNVGYCLLNTRSVQALGQKFPR